MYQARRAIAPIEIWDPNATMGDTCQIDRYPTYGERGLSKQQRTRDAQQVIGTGSTENVEKTSRQVKLVEFTGPSTRSGLPACLHLTKKDMRFARQKLWEYMQMGDAEGGIKAFHQSIGSMLLADDYARFDDRALVEELTRCLFKYNPQAKSDANVLGADKFNTQDLMVLGEQLGTLNTPKFPETGRWHMLASLRHVRHLREDEDFKRVDVARIQGGGPQVPNESLYMRGSMPSGMMATGMGPMGEPYPPIEYDDFLIFPTNTLPTRVVNTLQGPRTAFLSFVFGPGSVGLVDGDKGPVVQEYGLTDYNRHWFYLWQKYGQYEYMLDDDQNSGICIETRTYAA